MQTTPQLDLRTGAGTRLTFVRPMLGVESVRALTGLSEDEILAEIYAGKILWAWNCSGASSERRQFLRIWNRSIICYINPALSQPESFDTVLNHLLPHRRLSLRCTEIMRTFNVSSQHVLNLLDAKLLARVPGDIGPKESPYVTRASVVKLLESRRLS